MIKSNINPYPPSYCTPTSNHDNPTPITAVGSLDSILVTVASTPSASGSNVPSRIRIEDLFTLKHQSTSKTTATQADESTWLT